MKVYKDCSLKRHNTFGIDARCRRLVVYESCADATAVARSLTEKDRPLLLLGAGSNLLLTQDFAGTVLTAASRFDVEDAFLDGQPDEVYLKCWAGTTFDDVVAYAVEHGWHGAENLSLIPGQVGASAVQNIGAYGAEVKDIIDKVEAVEIATGRRRMFTRDECGYAYRQSRFKHEWKNRYLITSVTYRLSTRFEPRLDYGNIRTRLAEEGIVEPTAAQLRQAIIDIRREKLPDPLVTGNAGSFFMNPIVSREKYEQLAVRYPDMPHYTVDATHEKIPAAWMIDQCGWKGRSLGHVGVHDKQALVLVNRGRATGHDIVELMHAIQHDVRERFGIELLPEVNVI